MLKDALTRCPIIRQILSYQFCRIDSGTKAGGHSNAGRLVFLCRLLCSTGNEHRVPPSR
jgi:hypothetical protein